MDYEERREVKRQISQLLADAGINQQTLKEMVKEEIDNKIKRAIEQETERIGEFYSDGFKGYIKNKVTDILGSYWVKQIFKEAVKEVMKDNVIKVVFDKNIVKEE